MNKNTNKPVVSNQYFKKFVLTTSAFPALPFSEQQTMFKERNVSRMRSVYSMMSLSFSKMHALPINWKPRKEGKSMLMFRTGCEKMLPNVCSA